MKHFLIWSVWINFQLRLQLQIIWVNSIDTITTVVKCELVKSWRNSDFNKLKSICLLCVSCNSYIKGLAVWKGNCSLRCFWNNFIAGNLDSAMPLSTLFTITILGTRNSNISELKKWIQWGSNSQPVDPESDD